MYRRTILIEGDPGVIEVANGGPDHLLLTAHLPHWGGLIHVVQQVRRLFNLDFDLEAASAALGDDPVLKTRIASLPGLRVPGAWDAFEVGVRAIVGQQVTVAGAGTIIGRVVARSGTLVPGLAQFGLTHVFPGAETLAAADLAGTGLTGARIAAIQSFARSVVDGTVRLDRSQTLDEQVATVAAVPGLRPLDGAVPGAPPRRGRRISGRRPRPAAIARSSDRRAADAAHGGRDGRAMAPLASIGGNPPLADPARHSGVALAPEFGTIRSQTRYLPDHVRRGCEALPCGLGAAPGGRVNVVDPRHGSAEEVLSWTYKRFRRVALVASFQAESMVLIDMACGLVPDPEVLTLDTGRLHEETHDFIEHVRRHFPIRLRILSPGLRRAGNDDRDARDDAVPPLARVAQRVLRACAR